jgi:hypothetical protein
MLHIVFQVSGRAPGAAAGASLLGEIFRKSFCRVFLRKPVPMREAVAVCPRRHPQLDVFRSGLM